MIKKTIFVTGGSGYLGTATCQLLLDRGHNVFNIDTREPKVYTKGLLSIMDAEVYDLMLDNKPDAVIHLAAKNGMQNSRIDPFAFYDRNVIDSVNFLKYAVDAGVKNFVFGSSGAWHTEVHTTGEMNPYIHTKIVFEEILKVTSPLCGVDYAILRYFNIAGADPDLRFGRDLPSSYMIPNMCQKILDNEEIIVYTGYPSTSDGSSIRDYIHVTDAAKATVDAAEHLMNNKGSFESGVGTGTSTSTLELISMFEKIVGHPIKYKVMKTTPTDPEVIVNFPGCRFANFDWRAEYTLEDIVRHELAWYKESRVK